MLVYHGTTTQRARRICHEGFLPKAPSRRVWFAEDRLYAFHRARTQARRSDDRPIVLACDLDVKALRAHLGSGRVMHKNRVVAIDGPIPTDALRWRQDADLSATPQEVAEWLNEILGLKSGAGVARGHPGVQRLARWIDQRIGSERGRDLRWSEILEVARRWLPELFVGVEVPTGRLRAHPRVGAIRVEADVPGRRRDPRLAEAVELLSEPRVKARIRGLERLADAEDPNLFDWCVMFLDDEAITGRLAALVALLRCVDAHPVVVEPLAASDNKRLRAAAVAALARHGGDAAPDWFRRGLKDPCACVRIATARQLAQLDPAGHQGIFELALHDPNPDVVRAARKHA